MGRKQYKKEYYQANKERLQEYQNNYYQVNKERIREYQRAYYKKNRDHLLRYARKYYKKHNERFRGYRKTWRKKYRALNPPAPGIIRCQSNLQKLMFAGEIPQNKADALRGYRRGDQPPEIDVRLSYHDGTRGPVKKVNIDLINHVFHQRPRNQTYWDLANWLRTNDPQDTQTFMLEAGTEIFYYP